MRKKLPRLSTIIFFILLILVILIDLPKSVPVIHPVIDFTVFGKKIHKEFDTKLGLDLKGGSHLVFEAEIGKLPAADRAGAPAGARRGITEQRITYF